MSERDLHNWEERREQLSALLDNELADAERAELEAHLQSCAACRAELESLRRASALLRALPQPALPRSFLLPMEPAAQPSTGERAELPRPAQRQPATPAQPARPAPIPLGPARSNRLRRSAQVVRWLSTVAAVLGLLLLCGSVLAYLPHGGGASTASAPNTYYRNTPTQNSGGTALGNMPPPESTAKSSYTQDRATPTARTPNPGSTATGSPFDGSGTPVSTRTDQGTGSGSGFTLSTPELGLLLLGVGLVGLIVAAILRRRWISRR